MYTIYVKFECLPQKREAFIQKVKETGVLEAIRAEDGCIKYDYYLAEKDPLELMVVEALHPGRNQLLPHLFQVEVPEIGLLSVEVVQGTDGPGIQIFFQLLVSFIWLLLGFFGPYDTSLA